MTDSTHITWHEHSVSRADRERLNGHPGAVVWFTGLSGCGKSTIANRVDHQLYQLGVHTMVLDGDNIRHGLNASPALLAAFGPSFAQRFGLGFSADDRRENVRRVGAVAQLLASAGLITLAAFVSPYRRDRHAVREFVEQHGRAGDFVEVFVDTELEVCEARDPKGLYKKARAGELKQFTGIDDPYEPPESPEIRLHGSGGSPDQLAAQVVDHLRKAGKLGIS